MRAAICWFVGIVVIGCGNAAAPTGVVCIDADDGCVCNVQSIPAQTTEMTTPTCDPTVLPDTICCADSVWPSSGSCGCFTSAIFCGVTPDYFGSLDGGPGEDGCVCSDQPVSPGVGQIVGATCYPGGTTTADGELGSCCTYPADTPGLLGVATCACGTALVCEAGATRVESCSAASFPTVTPTCDGEGVEVAKCR